MAEPPPLMDKSALRAAVKHARAAPVNAAFAAGKDTKAAFLMLDKIKAPMALSKLVEKDGPGAFNTRFGTAMVPEEEPKLMRFVINRAVSQMARRLVKAMKGTGITKIEIMLEDGTMVESVAEEDETEEGAGTATSASPAPGSAPPGGPAPPPTQPQQNQADGPSPQDALHQALAALMGGLKAAIAADPSRKDMLLGLAGAAQAHIKSEDYQAAAGSIEQLKQALAGGAAPTAEPTAPQGVVGYAKSRLAWIKVRQNLEGDIRRLRAEIMATYEDEDPSTLGEIDKNYNEKTAPVLLALDEELAERLDDATNEADPEKRAALVDAARQSIARYQAFVTGDPVIADLDDNPFVPLAIGPTLNATLKTLAAAPH
jgi:hypothetical protein